MKITGFCPIIVTKDQESVVKTFEALGFERRHKKTDIEARQNASDALGMEVDVVSMSGIDKEFWEEIRGTEVLLYES